MICLWLEEASLEPVRELKEMPGFTFGDCLNCKKVIECFQVDL